MSTRQISIKIKEEYDLIVVEDEILSIVTDRKNINFQIDYEKDILINLKGNRYDLMIEKGNENISHYIDEYINNNNYGEEGKELINKYIYKVFENNLSEFQTLLRSTEHADCETFFDFSKSETDIIRGFLNWDCPKKNELLLSIANYALEYTFLTGKSSNINNSNYKNVFNSKKIYIDTNIVFYCLGINGEEYKKQIGYF